MHADRGVAVNPCDSTPGLIALGRCWDFSPLNVASARVVTGGDIERIRIVLNAATGQMGEKLGIKCVFRINGLVSASSVVRKVVSNMPFSKCQSSGIS